MPIYFILLDLVVFGGLVALVEFEMGVFAGVLLAAAAALYYFLAGFNPISWVANNAGLTFWSVIAYIIAGVVWSVAKWYFHTRSASVQSKIKDMHERYVSDTTPIDANSSNKIDPKFYKANFTGTFEEYLASFKSSNPVSVLNNKARILRWMGWWPVSLFWTATHDLIHNIFTFFYDNLAKVYMAISRAAIKAAIGNTIQ